MLYDRIIGVGGDKIPVHSFVSVLGEFARGRITGAQAQAIVDDITGSPLSPSEVTEAQALLATITGTATAKLARAREIDDVLLLGKARAPGYDTGAALKTRLGV